MLKFEGQRQVSKLVELFFKMMQILNDDVSMLALMEHFTMMD